MNFKDEAAEFILLYIQWAGRGLPASGARRDADKIVQHFPYPKVIDGAAEENGTHFPGQVVVHIQLAVYSIYQFYILPEGGSIFFPQFLIQQVAVEVVDLYHILIPRLRFVL